MRHFPDIPYIFPETERQRIDISIPDKFNYPTVVWFHGGGIESGDRRSDWIPWGLVKNGIAVASAGYRLYPNAKYPDFLEDAAKAVAYCVKTLKTLDGNGQVFVGGSSAGAYIAMMLCLNKEFLRNEGVDEEKDIAGFISDSAQVFTHFNVLREMGIDSRIQHIDDRAPIYYVNSSLTLRPLLMLYYKNDMVCRPEENKLFYTSLKRFLPDSDVTLTELEGTHCSADKPDENGERRIEKYLLEFIKSH